LTQNPQGGPLPPTLNKTGGNNKKRFGERNLGEKRGGFSEEK